MSRRFASLAVTCSIVLGLASPVFVRAEDVAAPDVVNSKYQFTGTINANAVYVRSGPGDNYYPTDKLDKGQSVTVVGIKFDWLKIVPPKGSFSYVAKAYVEKRGDGTVGRVTKPDLNVRAGSTLNPMKTTVQTKLEANTDVKILGEQDEYFKIVPPEGTFVYVAKQFVDPGQPLVAAATPARIDAEPIASAPMKIESPATIDGKAIASLTPSTQPAADAGTVVPSTQPVAHVPSIDEKFDKVETDFMAASKQPIQEQPISDLKTAYETITADASLPISMRRVAELRISTLKLRTEAQEQFVASKKMQEEAATKAQALKAEQEELTTRIKATEITIYSALGTLRTSSLQQGAGVLYRLTDPSTGRTMVYLRSGDPKQLNGYMGQFIGVKGDITTDPVLNAKMISPTAIETVDVSKVNNGVTAQVIPPSLLPQRNQVSAAGN